MSESQAEVPYVSGVQNIRRGRQSFHRRDEYDSASYMVAEEKGGEGGGVEGEPSVWRLTRLACKQYPDQPLLTFPSLAAAERAADWCVRNDPTVQITMHWLARKQLDPFFHLLDALTEASKDA